MADDDKVDSRSGLSEVDEEAVFQAWFNVASRRFKLSEADMHWWVAYHEQLKFYAKLIAAFIVTGVLGVIGSLLLWLILFAIQHIEQIGEHL